MATSKADVATSQASKYLQQLCKHWSHRFETKFDSEHGVVDFGTSVCKLDAGSTQLSVEVTASLNELQETRDAVAEHLQRFAHREELIIEWRNPDG